MLPRGGLPLLKRFNNLPKGGTPTAFEATQKAVYLYGKALSGAKADDLKPVKNDFQNVDIAQGRFAELGIDPFTCLEPDALAVLKLNIQKRHIIGHNLGVMDERFASHAEGGDVIAFAESCQRVVTVLDDWLTGPRETAAMINLGKATATATEVPVAEVPKPEVDLGLGLGPLAQRLGLWIATQSEIGLPDFVHDEAITSAFPDEDSAAIKEAIAELELDGYLSSLHRGMVLPSIRPTVDLFAAFDRKAIGTDPLTDAAELTKKILAGQEQIRVADLHTETGWTLRRFNPALSLVLGKIDSDRVSRTMASVYPTGFFFLQAVDRVSLKRFLGQSES